MADHYYRLRYEPLERPGFFARLFGRKIPANAIREINNALLIKGIAGLTRADVATALHRHGAKRADGTAGLVAIYERVLIFFASDDDLSDTEAAELRQLRDVLALSAGDVAETDGALYRRLVEQALADRVLSDEEEARLERAAAALALPETTSRRIYADSATALLHKVAHEAIEDRQLSPGEEADLHRLAKDLGITLTYDQETMQIFDLCRLLWRVGQGDLPDVAVPISLRRDERCHFSIAAEHHERRTRTTAIRYSGPSARISIMRGVSWRVGQVNIDRVTTEELVHLDTGTIYLTNERLLFDGQRKNTTLPLKKIINFTSYADGLSVEKDSGKDQIFMYAGNDPNRAMLVHAIMQAAIAIAVNGPPAKSAPATAASSPHAPARRRAAARTPAIRTFHTKVVGVQWANADGSARQGVIQRCRVGERLLFVREPDNSSDPNAVRICRDSGEQLGYLSANLAEEIGPRIDDGWIYAVRLKDITGGDGRHLGANLAVAAGNPGADHAEVEAALRFSLPETRT